MPGDNLFEETINDVIPVIIEDYEKEWVKPDCLSPIILTDTISLVMTEYCDYGKLYNFPDTNNPDIVSGEKAEYHEEKWELQIQTATTNNRQHTFLNDYTLKDVWDKFKFDILKYAGLSQEDIEKAKASFFMRDTGKPLYKSAETEFCSIKASKIHEAGQLFEFVVYCCNKQHQGNTHIIIAMIFSFANTLVQNRACNINLGIFSEAHAGKTHVKDTVKRYLPDGVIDDSVKSDKAMYYDNSLRPGTVIVQDDQTLSEERQNIYKNLKPNEPLIHKTVKNQEYLQNEIPENCPTWTIKVETQGDEQIMDRQLNLWCDDETPQYQQARRNIQNEVWGETGNTINEYLIDSKTCKALWELVKPGYVEIPYRNNILGNMDQPRIYNLLCQMICASALLHAPCRERNPAGRIIATRTDFNIAANLMNGLLSNTKGSQLLGLSKNQIKIINTFEELGTGVHSRRILAGESGLSEGQLSKAIKGCKSESLDGLLKICPAINEVTTQTRISSIDDTRTDPTNVSRKSYEWNSHAYKKWIGKYELFSLKP